MYYRREGRRRRLERQENLPPSSRGPRPPGRNRGAKFTFFSFFAIAAFLAVMKAANPGMSMRSPLLMFGSAALACIIMFRIGRKNR